MEELNEVVYKVNELVTIDPYYDLSDYNEALQALENNKIKYKEWISTFSPYEFYLHLDGQKPVMMNYDIPTKTIWQKLVSKVQPLTINDEVVLYRRGNNVSNLKDYINNDVFKTAFNAKDTIVFLYENKEQLLSLSKTYGVIYPIGKYLKGAKRLAICFDTKIKNVLTPSDIQLEIGKHKIGELEMKINYKVLRNIDKIEKWVRTPKFKDGKYLPTRPMSPMKI